MLALSTRTREAILLYIEDLTIGNVMHKAHCHFYITRPLVWTMNYSSVFLLTGQSLQLDITLEERHFKPFPYPKFGWKEMGERREERRRRDHNVQNFSIFWNVLSFSLGFTPSASYHNQALGEPFSNIQLLTKPIYLRFKNHGKRKWSQDSSRCDWKLRFKKRSPLEDLIFKAYTLSESCCRWLQFWCRILPAVMNSFHLIKNLWHSTINTKLPAEKAVQGKGISVYYYIIRASCMI